MKKQDFRRLFATTVFFVGLVMSVGIANAAHYYVSSSTGDDFGAGTMSDPWKTLTRAAEQEYQPGDVIYLKGGDIWEESFQPKSSGNPDISIPDGKWNDEGFITLTSYGCKKRPVIAAGPEKVYGILLESVAGWKIENIEICNTMAGVRMIMNRSDAQSNGLWIENCYFHDIENAPQTPLHKESGLYMSYAVSTYCDQGGVVVPMIQNVKIANSVFERNDTPMTISDVNGLILENLVTKDNYKEGILLTNINSSSAYSKGSYMTGCRILRTGAPKGMYWGVAGLQFNSVKNFDVSKCEIAYTKAPGKPDGCGVDYEAKNVNVTVRECYIHDNEGPAFLIFRNGSWGLDNVNTYIDNNYLIHNGLKNIKTEHSAIMHKFNLESGGSISGNTIAVFEGQPAVSIDGVNQVVTKDAQSGEYVTAWPGSYVVQNNKISVNNPKTTTMDGSSDEAYMKLIMGEDYIYESYAEKGYEGNYQKTYDKYYVSHDEFDDSEITIVKKYDFNDRTGTDGWTAGAAVGNFATSVDEGATVLQGNFIKADPFIYSPDNLGINIDEAKIIIFRMKQTSDRNEGRIYFLTDDSTSWGETKANGFAIDRTSDGEYVTYYVDMSWIYSYQGTLKQLRFDPIDNYAKVSGGFKLDYIAFAKKKDYKPPVTGPEDAIVPPNEPIDYVVKSTENQNISIIKGYDFNTDGDTEGWTGTSNIIGPEIVDGELRAEIVKNDPFVYTPDQLNIEIDPDVPLILKFRFRHNTRYGKIRIYFTTNENPNWGESQAFYIDGYDYNQTNYMDFCVDVSPVGSLKGTLKQIRFDPIDNNPSITGEFALDYFYIGVPAGSAVVQTADWATTSIKKVADAGGADWNLEAGFNPMTPVTRGDMAEYVTRSLRLKNVGYHGEFSDVRSTDEQADYIAAACRSGIMVGHADGTFAPAELLTREQAAVIFGNILGILGVTENTVDLTTYNDFEEFSSYSLPYVGTVVTSGIMRGVASDEFSPKTTLNCAQVAVMLAKLLEHDQLKIEQIIDAENAVEEYFEFKFDFNDDDPEGWYAGNGVSGLAAADGELFAQITAKDPFIYSPDNLGIDINENKFIKIRFRHNTKRGNAGFFYITEDDTAWGEDKYVGVTSATTNPEFVEYYFDMTAVPKFVGTLKQIRFDPIANLNNVTGEFGLDYVYIGTK